MHSKTERDLRREQLIRDVADFLDKGGTIQQIPTGYGVPLKTFSDRKRGKNKEIEAEEFCEG